MVTLRELKSQRKAAFRAVRKSLNVVQKKLNLLHRELNRRLEKHNIELLDTSDAERVVELTKELYQQISAFASDVVNGLAAFFD